MEFEKTQSASLKELFIRSMEKSIISGELEIGTKLPSERVLAENMGVSRAVVNSGIMELARKGFIDIRPRIGTFVADYRKKGTMDILVSIMKYHGEYLQSEDIKSLLEFRCAVDIMVLKLLEGNLESEDFRLLDQCVESIRLAEEPFEAAQHNFSFHHKLALMCGNTIVPLIYSSFEYISTHLWSRYAAKYGIDGLYQNSRRLLDLIKEDNIQEAIRWKESYSNDAVFGAKQIYDL